MNPMSALLCTAAALTATTSLALASAPVGQPAPDFAVSDLDGKTVKLADYRGKYVVLEWTNPGCPFVQKHYNSGNMPQLQKDLTAKNVVWLTVDSTRTDHRDYKTPEQLRAWEKEKGAAPSATLRDNDGKIGKAYGAKTTPHMYIIDPQGTLIYAGAIDDKRSANVKDVQTAKNYVRTALTETQAGKAVSAASTNAYGCAIKYAE